MTVYPWGYGTECLEIDGLFARVESEQGGPMHPEFRWWLWRWLEANGGLIGIGDGWRPHGSDTSGASSANKSFHQTQTFASGRSTWCAVDVVAVNPGGNHRTVQWHEVPEQGSTDAAYWNVHANVPGEPWHIQPVNIDGFDSWVNAGRPDPTAPISNTDPVTPTPGDDEMSVLLQPHDGTPDQHSTVFWWDGKLIGWVRTGTAVDVGRVCGLYTSTPLENFSVGELQAMIDSGWAGGPIPPGFNAPSAVDSGVT